MATGSGSDRDEIGARGTKEGNRFLRSGLKDVGWRIQDIEVGRAGGEEIDRVDEFSPTSVISATYAATF